MIFPNSLLSGLFLTTWFCYQIWSGIQLNTCCDGDCFLMKCVISPHHMTLWSGFCLISWSYNHIGSGIWDDNLWWVAFHGWVMRGLGLLISISLTIHWWKCLMMLVADPALLCARYDVVSFCVLWRFIIRKGGSSDVDVLRVDCLGGWWLWWSFSGVGCCSLLSISTTPSSASSLAWLVIVLQASWGQVLMQASSPQCSLMFLMLAWLTQVDHLLKIHHHLHCHHPPDQQATCQLLQRLASIIRGFWCSHNNTWLNNRPKCGTNNGSGKPLREPKVMPKLVSGNQFWYLHGSKSGSKSGSWEPFLVLIWVQKWFQKWFQGTTFATMVKVLDPLLEPLLGPVLEPLLGPYVYYSAENIGVPPNVVPKVVPKVGPKLWPLFQKWFHGTTFGTTFGPI